MKFLVIILLEAIALYGNTSDIYALTENLSTDKVLVDSNIFKYFPLNIGNRWVWYVQRNFAPGPSYESTLILSTQILNGHLFYKGKSDAYYINTNQHHIDSVYYRIDSITGNLYNFIFPNNTQCLVDSLNSSRNDSAITACTGSWYKYDTSSYQFFNQNYFAKKFTALNVIEGGINRKYVKDFGYVYSYTQLQMGQKTLNLKGCVINGNLFGDTTILVGINEINLEIPDEFELSQNYPNPFNPTTHFGFRIAKFGLVKLTIYDALGKEVELLVNKELQSGSYEADWDASAYPSGVYYYKLESGSFTETKKMVLIK